MPELLKRFEWEEIVEHLVLMDWEANGPPQSEEQMIGVLDVMASAFMAAKGEG